MLNYHTNLVESRHFDFAPDLPDFRGGAFPRVVRFLVDTSIRTSARFESTRRIEREPFQT